MTADQQQMLYADVLLRPASGKTVADDTPITANNIGSMTPSDADVEVVRSWFENAGFQTSALAGISIGISGTLQQFEDFFESTIYQNEQGYYSVHPGNEITDFELPAGVLDGQVADLVQAITFSAPIDFGPEGSFD